MEIQDGLTELPIPEYLFVKLNKDEIGTYCWYSYNSDLDVSTPIRQSAVLGTLAGIKITKHLYKKEFNYKVNFIIKTSRKTFVIRSGDDTTFTRGILLALNNVEPEKIEDNFYFGVSAGSEAVYGLLYTKNGERVKYEWDSESKLAPIIEKLQTLLDIEVQTLKSINADYEKKHPSEAPNTQSKDNKSK